MMLRTRALPVVGLVVLGLAALGAATLGAAYVERADCPGKIVCPQTGELICRDRCPTIDANRPDCPGRIVCPETGKLICKDRCQLNDTTNESPKTGDKPSCCRKGR